MNYQERIEWVKKLGSGTFALKTSVYNPNHDRRCKRDWTKFPSWKAGTLFQLMVREIEDDMGKRLVVRLFPYGNRRFAFISEDAFGLIISNLEKIQELPSDYLDREYSLRFGASVLDRLVKDGKITLEDVIQTAEKVDQELLEEERNKSQAQTR